MEYRLIQGETGGKGKKGSRRAKATKKVKTEDEDESSDWSDVSSDEDEKNEDGSKKIRDEVLFAKHPVENVKMVLIVREDLKMGKGKIGAQCGHATIGVYKTCSKYSKGSEYWKKVLDKWNWEGSKKICLKVNSE